MDNQDTFYYIYENQVRNLVSDVDKLSIHLTLHKVM